MNTLRFTQFVRMSTVSFMLLSLGLRGSPAHALPATDPPQKEKALNCLGDLQGTLSTSAKSPAPNTPPTINLWDSTTLSWNVTVPSSCTGTGLKLYVDGVVVSPLGSRSIQPIADTIYRLHAALPAALGGGRRTLTTTAIKVIMPSVVTINANYMAPLLVQALSDPFIPGTNSRYIYIENHVELDLSGRESIPIEAGVTLAGGRTARQPGPRLYTTTCPDYLLNVVGDNVRITGVRIQGPDLGMAYKEDTCAGIYVNAFVNIDIHNNELFGWSGSAVRIHDNSDDRISYVGNPEAVRIRDNYIHHNQNNDEMGYGVEVSDGAYALIERNVFDYNRHAISGDGSDGSGYQAYRNLVLEHGGEHQWLGLWFHTHQFDMHGQEGCFPTYSYNCGRAGEYVDIQYNSFFYTADNAIKLRGTPTIGFDVTANVFAHAALFTTPSPFSNQPPILGAIEQTESGLDAVNNLIGVNGMNERRDVNGMNELTDVNGMKKLGVCDFDGDGLNDSFLATGQTWWYSSGGNMPWVYLNTSTKRRSQVVLGFFDGDNICDVSVDGVIYPGGRTKKLSVSPLPGGGVLQ